MLALLVVGHAQAAHGFPEAHRPRRVQTLLANPVLGPLLARLMSQAKFDATMQGGKQTISNRTSFVIAPNGTILLSYTDMNPQAHIEKTMAAVRAWKARHG